MRSEQEIRKRMKLLRDSVTPNCQCRKCVGNLACANALEWALGIDNLDPRAEEEFAAEVARKRAERAR